MPTSHRDAVQYKNSYFGFSQKLNVHAKSKATIELSTDRSASSTPKALNKYQKSICNYNLKL